jgi:zinc transport system substrate-binding protein
MKFKRVVFLGVSLTLVSGLAAPVSATDNIVVSIKPIHSLVASVTKGVSEPFLILQRQASPHTYSLRPSEARKLRNAKIVFWIGEEFENFLVKPLKTLGRRAQIVTLSKTEQLTRHKFRKAVQFKSTSAKTKKHDHGHHHGNIDQHFWLDPVNAIAFSREIETTLKSIDPANTRIYISNANQLRARLKTLQKKTAARLMPLRQGRFYVFHDAYQYFENRFGLSARGAIIFHPDIPLSAKRVSQIQNSIKKAGPVCVFSEPQFNPKTVKLVTRGTAARLAILDPIGSALSAGPDLYFQLIEKISSSFEKCLSDVRRN